MNIEEQRVYKLKIFDYGRNIHRDTIKLKRFESLE